MSDKKLKEFETIEEAEEAQVVLKESGIQSIVFEMCLMVHIGDFIKARDALINQEEAKNVLE